MEVIRFDIEKHLPIVNDWLSEYKQDPLSKEIIPKNGFYVEDVAVLFLYKTDSCMALIENLIFNPSASYEIRTDALLDIYVELQKEAFSTNHRLIMAITSLSSVEERCKLVGLVENKKTFKIYGRLY